MLDPSAYETLHALSKSQVSVSRDRSRDQNHPKEKEMQKVKWLSKEALQIDEKIREKQKAKEKRKDILK